MLRASVVILLICCFSYHSYAQCAYSNSLTIGLGGCVGCNAIFTPQDPNLLFNGQNQAVTIGFNGTFTASTPLTNFVDLPYTLSINGNPAINGIIGFNGIDFFAANAKNATIYVDQNGNANLPVHLVNNGSQDFCATPGSINLSVSPNQFNCSHIGTPQAVTLTLVGAPFAAAPGQPPPVSTDNATVTVLDNLPPVFTNCNDQFKKVDTTLCTTTIIYQTPAAVDNCQLSHINYISGPMSGSILPPGEYSITYQAFDIYNNSSFCTFEYTVFDNQDPFVTCASPKMTLLTDTLVIQPFDLAATFGDNCEIDKIFTVPPTLDCSHVDSITPVILYVQDKAGNWDSCLAKIPLNETLPPVANCYKNISLVISSIPDQDTISILDIDSMSFDHCGIDTSYIIGQRKYSCNDVGGVSTVTLVLRDVNGNSSSCSSVVTPVDTINPEALCIHDTIILLNENGIAILAAAEIDSGSSDQCGIDTIILSKGQFSCSDTGLNIVILEVTDKFGNKSSCTSKVTVLDKELPTALCKSKVTIPLFGASDSTIAAVAVDSGSFDNCAIDSVGVWPNRFTCLSQDTTITSTLTVRDASGNESSCTTIIVIRDIEAPKAICKSLIKVFINSTTASKSFTLQEIDSASSDNCSIVDLFLKGQTTFSCADVGDTTLSVTLSVVDSAGNSSECKTKISVCDNERPKAVCDQNVDVYLDSSGIAQISADDIDLGSSDNCKIAGKKIDSTTFNCIEIGINSVTLIVEDNEGNKDTCIANVSVKDTIPPTPRCKNIDYHLDNNGLVFPKVSDIDSGSFDNCSFTLSLDKDSLSCQDGGKEEVVLTITDFLGNKDSCLVKVNILDTLPPSAVCNNGFTIYLNNNGTLQLPVHVFDGGSIDNCSFNLSVDEFMFDCTDVGKNTVVLTIVDQFGLKDTCHSSFNVKDLIKPIASCHGTITVYSNANGIAQLTPSMLDNGSSDNCGSVSMSLNISQIQCSNNSVVLSVSDPSGNTRSCSTTVISVDTISPDLNCNDLTLELSSSGFATITSADVASSITDGCGISSVVLDQTIYGCVNLGSNVGTLSATDINGNTSSCSFNVTVTDPNTYCQPSCTAPSNLSANAGFRRATLSWSFIPSAVSYIISGGEVGGSQVQISHNTNSIEVKGLKPGKTYQWQVGSICGTSVSGFSASHTFTTLSCEAPINLSTTNITNSSATLNWDPVANAIGYRLIGGTSTKVLATLDIPGGGSNIYNANGLASNTNYSWAVHSICQASPFVMSPRSLVQNLSTLGVSTKTISANEDAIQFTIVPNPNNGRFELKFDGLDKEYFEVNIYDVFGKLLLSKQESGSDRIQYMLDHLNSGLYLVEINVGGAAYYERLVVN